MKSTTVQVRTKGQFTIPAEIREALDIDENKVMTVTLLGNEAMLVIPQKLKTQELLKKTAEMAKRQGLTLEEMLAELDEIRHNA